MLKSLSRLGMGKSGYPGFAPPVVPMPGTPNIWYDSQDINLLGNVGISDTDPIATWKNKGSTASADAIQATGAVQPTFDASDPTLNKPVVSFISQRMATGNVAIGSGQPFTVVLVFKLNSAAGLQALFDVTNTASEATFYLNTGNMNMYAGALGMQALTPGTTDWRYAICKFDGATSTLKIDGSSFGPGDAGANWFSNGLNIGSLFNNTSTMNGSIAELFIYGGGNTPPSDASIIAYLNYRYGSTWPKT